MDYFHLALASIAVQLFLLKVSIIGRKQWSGLVHMKRAIPTVKSEQLHSQLKVLEIMRRNGLMSQLFCLKFSFTARFSYQRSYMQGRWKGVATQIKKDNPAAIAVHCLNLCFQYAGRHTSLILRYSLDIVQEIGKLIRFSPKRLMLLSVSQLFSNQIDSSYSCIQGSPDMF